MKTKITRTDLELEARAWDISLGHYLSDYPIHKPYGEILKLIEEDSDEVSYWEPYEYSDPYWIIAQIENMQYYILGELEWARGEKP